MSRDRKLTVEKISSKLELCRSIERGFKKAGSLSSEQDEATFIRKLYLQFLNIQDVANYAIKNIESFADSIDEAKKKTVGILRNTFCDDNGDDDVDLACYVVFHLGCYRYEDLGINSFADVREKIKNLESVRAGLEKAGKFPEDIPKSDIVTYLTKLYIQFQNIQKVAEYALEHIDRFEFSKSRALEKVRDILVKKLSGDEDLDNACFYILERNGCITQFVGNGIDDELDNDSEEYVKLKSVLERMPLIL